MKTAPEAVIDLGSHSALLLIAQQKDGKWQILHEDFAIIRLGQGVKQSGYLNEKGQQTALVVLQRFKETAKEFNCQSIAVLATEAMRQANNAQEFIKEVKKRLGLKVHILTAEQEAVFSYRGAISVVDNFEQKAFVVIDVGGGSTEITLGKGTNIHNRASMSIGAVTLAEQMRFKIQLGSSDRMGLMQVVKSELVKLAVWNEINDSLVVIGSGGTITTLAAIHHRLKNYDADVINHTLLERSQIWQMYYWLNDLDLNRRKAVPGLEPGREDVIIYGMLIYLTILELRQLLWIRVSARGLRFGYLLTKLEKSNIDGETEF